MPRSIALGGFVLWLVIVLLYGTAALALYVFQDALRRKETDFAAVPEPRWLYVIPQGVFFIAFVLEQFPPIGAIIAAGVVLATPLALIEQIAYLLRIVFPTQARREARLAAEQQALLGDAEAKQRRERPEQ